MPKGVRVMDIRKQTAAFIQAKRVSAKYLCAKALASSGFIRWLGYN